MTPYLLLVGHNGSRRLTLKSGYHHIEIQPSDRPLIAFAMPESGLWQFRVLPFGCRVFSSGSSRVISGFNNVTLLIYLDDIIVYSKTFKTHLENLKEILERLKEANLKLIPKKCKIFCKTVGWLCWGLTSQSTIFQSCRDGAIASWVINQYFRGVKCLAQGHNTAAVGLEPRTSRSGVLQDGVFPRASGFERGHFYREWKDTKCSWLASAKEYQGGALFLWLDKLLQEILPKLCNHLQTPV